MCSPEVASPCRGHDGGSRVPFRVSAVIVVCGRDPRLADVVLGYVRCVPMVAAVPDCYALACDAFGKVEKGDKVRFARRHGIFAPTPFPAFPADGRCPPEWDGVRRVTLRSLHQPRILATSGPRSADGTEAPGSLVPPGCCTFQQKGHWPVPLRLTGRIEKPESRHPVEQAIWAGTARRDCADYRHPATFAGRPHQPEEFRQSRGGEADRWHGRIGSLQLSY